MSRVNYFNNTDTDSGIVSLTQYKLDSDDDTASEDSDIEVCVDSIFITDTEGQCCQMLLNKYMKQRMFTLWKIKAASAARPVFEREEFEGLKAQANQNATALLKRQRFKFLEQYASLAQISLSKFRMSRLFSRWLQKAGELRLKRIQESFATVFAEKRRSERSFYKIRHEALRRSLTERDGADREASLTGGDRTYKLLEELTRTTRSNEILQQEIQAKTNHLSDLQSKLRDVTAEATESERQLADVERRTQEIQQSIGETEKRYQEEVSNLKTRLSLEENSAKEELAKVTQALEEESSDRKAAAEFVDAAQAQAKKELDQLQEKLNAAQDVVRKFKDLLAESEGRAQKLQQTKDQIDSEIKNLNLKIQQLESAKQSAQRISNERETEMKNLLSKAQEELRVALSHVEAQEAQIQSQQKEIALLKDSIEENQRKTKKIHDRWMAQSGLPIRN